MSAIAYERSFVKPFLDIIKADLAGCRGNCRSLVVHLPWELQYRKESDRCLPVQKTSIDIPLDLGLDHACIECLHLLLTSKHDPRWYGPIDCHVVPA